MKIFLFTTSGQQGFVRIKRFPAYNQIKGLVIRLKWNLLKCMRNLLRNRIDNPIWCREMWAMTVLIINRFKMGKHRYSYRRFFFYDKTIRSDFLCFTNTPKKSVLPSPYFCTKPKKKLVFIWLNFSWSALHSGHTTYIFQRDDIY